MSSSSSGGSGSGSGSIDTSLFARVGRVNNLADKLGTVMATLTSSVLGYQFLENPQGFVLAVLLDAVVGWIEGITNAIAAEIDRLLTTLADVFVDGLDSAFGPAGRIVAESVLALLGGVNEFAVDLAASSGPLGFVFIPIVWVVTLVAVVTGAVGVWRLYKWIRTVVV